MLTVHGNLSPLSARWFSVAVLLLIISSCGCREVDYKFTRPRVRGGQGRREVRSLLTDASSAPGLCDSIIKAAGYPCEEITFRKLRDSEHDHVAHFETHDLINFGMLETTAKVTNIFMEDSVVGELDGPNLRWIFAGIATYSAWGWVGQSYSKTAACFSPTWFNSGGDNWVLNSPAQSLAYILADQGFDVWIGNLRGTRFSHGHTNLSPNDWRFWDWSFNEHASIDMPTMVGYVHRATASQVNYVGHSQGTIVALAALSDSTTGMSNMVKAAVFLAPIAYMQRMKSQLLSVSVDLMLDKIIGIFGTREFNLNNEVGESLLNLACAEPNVFCDDLFRAYTGPNCCFNNSRALYYLQWEPQSTSTKNLQHLAQMIRSGRFEKFDYGWLGNMLHYKQGAPPLYEISRIPPSTNVFLVSGDQDGLADSSDVKKLQEEMTCQVQALVLPGYGHADFVVGTRAHVDVYNPVVQYLKSLQ